MRPGRQTAAHRAAAALFVAAVLLAASPAAGLAPQPAAARDGASLETALRISDLPDCGADGSLQPATDRCTLSTRMSGAGVARWWAGMGHGAAAGRRGASAPPRSLDALQEPGARPPARG
jgi:hypothetical protein